MESEKPTNPHGTMISQDDLIAYLVGAMQRIESQLASDEPPLWAKRLIGELSHRIISLEGEVQKIKLTCAAKHSNGNGQLKLPLI